MTSREPALATLRNLFADSLYRAAERLVESGGVSHVRVLQGGRVITGIVEADWRKTASAAAHRVYIQCRTVDGNELEGECSCGDPAGCVHVAAVSIAAFRSAGAPTTDQPGNAMSTPRPRSLPAQPDFASGSHMAPLSHRLCYLIEAPGPRTDGFKSRNGLELTVWLIPRSINDALAEPGDARVQPDAVCPFTLRTSDGAGDYPRYVDAQDREILRALMAQNREAPWKLHGATGFELVRRAVATGRARWQSTAGAALRAGKSRCIPFSWEALRNGDQILDDGTTGRLGIVVDLEPVMYIDFESNECGPVDCDCPDLLRRYWNSPPISPERVAAVNQDIEREFQAGAFPRLRALSVQAQPLASLRARLMLSAGPTATLYFVLNGIAVDSHDLPAGRHTARQIRGDIIHDIDRDSDTEQRLRAQLDGLLPASPLHRDAWIAFMHSSVPALRAEGWEVIVDARFPYRLAEAEDWYANLQPSGREEWFDLRLGLMVDGMPVNLLPALVTFLREAAADSLPDSTTSAATSRIDVPLAVIPKADGVTGRMLRAAPRDHVFVELEDGRYLPVPIDRIRRIADTLVELFDQQGLDQRQCLSLPRSQAGRLAQLAGEPAAPALRSYDAALLARIEDLKAFSAVEPLPGPAAFPAALRPYQQHGLGWLQCLRRYGQGGILADDMGLGKTVQTLAHLALEQQQGRLRRPSLIVAPVSVLGNWRREIERFTPQFEVLTLHGPKRRGLIERMAGADIIITSYPLLVLDAQTLLTHEFYYLILDEAQTIKNPRARVSVAARALRAQHRLCLTGTPMENHLGDLWSLFDFLQPGFLGDEKQFQREYRGPIEGEGSKTRAQGLNQRIQPFLLRRTKDAVAADLPPKMQIVEYIALDEDQRDFYDGIRLAMHQRVRDAIQLHGLARSRIAMLDALLKLRQACCDPRLVKTHDQAARPDASPAGSAKLDWLAESLPELIAAGRRILLFSQFTSMLRLIEGLVRELSIPYFLLTGATRDRTPLVEGYQAGAVPLFLISLKAGGTGLNLTAADTVIHYDPWWNPAAELQATDRAHRIGQDHPVFVYKLIAQSTVEEKILRLQADKQALLNRVYGGQDGSPARLEAAELAALFEP